MNKSMIRLLFLSSALVAVPANAQNRQSPLDEAAQEQGEGSAELGGGQIIVTAQKRSERLQDVPLAITAVTGAALEARNITDTKNLVQVAPSLSFGQGNNPNNSSFRIRGIGTSVFGVGSESSVSVVVDGVVMARAAQGFTDLADIERIEVLRGPQGTLFGKNATGGVISVVTARPTDYVSGKVRATIAEHDEYHINGTVAGPVSDNIGARITAYYNDDKGIYDNLANGDRVNATQSWGLRGKLEFDIGDLNLLASASYNEIDSNCCQSALVRSDSAILDQLVAPVVARPFNTDVSSNGNAVSNTDLAIYSLEANYDLGWGSITSITAYQKYNFLGGFDVDGINTPEPIYTGGAGTAPFYAQFDINSGPFDIGQFSQELRIASAGDQAFNYVAGVYYDNTKINRSFGRRIVNCPTSDPLNQGLAIGVICPAPVGTSGSATSHLEQEQIAAFGQVDFTIVGGLKALAGIRVQHQSMWVEGAQDIGPIVPGDVPMFTGATLTSGRTDAKDDAVTGRAGLQYEFSPDAQAYATYSRGYKGQSLGTEFNQTFNNNPVVEPETVNAYEVGFKASTTDNLLSVSLAGFIADYKNLQVQANRSDNSTGTFLFVVTNAGTASTKGVELEATVRPTEGFSVHLGAAYIHGRFDADGLACPLQQRLGVPVVPSTNVPANTCVRVQSLDSSGNVIATSGATQYVRDGKLPNTPEFRFSLNPHYELDVSADHVAYVDAIIDYQSKVNFSLEQDPLTYQDGFATVDLTVGVRPIGTGFSASIFVKNLFDKQYYTGLGHASTATAQNVTPNNLLGYTPKAAFRYFGATVGYSF
ncbi:TonB-dependent receptor [Altererythrobacter sp. B11]|uniref:TonB-dependent receptor n=1 Tax=Altererythrobacter sp. B11 TaxID=2060312 RepID=UPI000DC6EBC1|nr:TonB-dependent receptor [Altererythrobacter sp. B11]BBC74279.1 TonB-dependent receptor [Altererythrobacter sp. B11]